MDGMILPRTQLEQGVTEPPFHPNCRCTTVPYDEDWDYKGQRIAKDKDGKYYYVPETMSYEEWKRAFVNDSTNDSIKAEYSKICETLDKKAPTLQNYLKLKSKPKDYKLFKAYVASIKNGELSSLADFELYRYTSNKMDEMLKDVVTSNGITITGKTNHSIARVIGSVEQKRNGVEIEDILEALTSDKPQISSVKKSANGNSIKFKSKKIEVSVNVNTGAIIQANPVHSKKRSEK